MSSTNRGSNRSENDFYVSPVPEVAKFLRAWAKVDPTVPRYILDPCAGGNTETIKIDRVDKDGEPKKNKKGQVLPPLIFPPSKPSYAQAFRLAAKEYDWATLTMMDIRENADCEWRGVDFLKTSRREIIDRTGVTRDAQPNGIVTNPPFDLAIEFLKHGAEVLGHGAHIAFLLRSNFLGSEERNEFLRAWMPEYQFFHGKRMSFTPDGKTDSIEYSHFVWRVGISSGATLTHLLEYGDESVEKLLL